MWQLSYLSVLTDWESVKEEHLRRHHYLGDGASFSAAGSVNGPESAIEKPRANAGACKGMHYVS